VAAVGIAQEFATVWTATKRDTDPAKPPQFTFTKLDADLDTLLIALYVELDDRIIPAHRPTPRRRGVGRPPAVTDTERSAWR
jgi:hypothetical protein